MTPRLSRIIAIIIIFNIYSNQIVNQAKEILIAFGLFDNLLDGNYQGNSQIGPVKVVLR